MKRKLAAAVAMASSAALSAAAHGQIAVNVYNSTVANPPYGSWTGVPIPNSADTTMNGGPSGGTATNNMPLFMVANGPGTGSDLNPVSWGQSIEAMTAGKLSDLEVLFTGTPPTTFNIALYDAGSAGATTPLAAANAAGNASPLADTGANGYTGSAGSSGAPGTVNTTFGGNGNGTTPNGGHYINTSLNLLSSTDSTGITVTGYGTTPNATGGMSAELDFHMTGADAINIVAGEEYVFEISGVSNPSSVYWDRQGATGDYPYGQAFIGQDPLNGNAARDFAVGMVVTPVPEPASVSALGLASLGLMARKRNKTA